MVRDIALPLGVVGDMWVWVCGVWEWFLEKVWFRARGAHFYRKSMVSCKRGTLLSNKYGFVQEGHTFIEKGMVSCKRGTHFST